MQKSTVLTPGSAAAVGAGQECEHQKHRGAMERHLRTVLKNGSPDGVKLFLATFSGL